jgi:tetratricopeptide (TPR) repeat protein
MRKGLIILVLIIIPCSAFSKSGKNSLAELRTEYLTALRDYLNAPKVYESFLKVENPNGKILAYQGTLVAIMTKTTWNIFKKMKYLTKSEDSFKKAISLDSNDLEIRFIRLAVQFNIPEYLGFSNKIESDKEFILKHAPSFDFQGIPATLGDKIIGFMHRCEKFTAVQVETIGNSLITFQKTTP